MAALFSPTVLRHFRNPSNYRDIEAPHITQEIENRVCGDRIRLSIRLDEERLGQEREYPEDRIDDAAFKGDCCAISKAATSLLTEMLPGLSLAEAAGLTDERLLAALEADVTPARMDCALLPLRALRAGIEAYRPAGEE